MSNSVIYQVGVNNFLTPLESKGYGTELVLQNLLAANPILLLGDQTESTDTQPWFFVGQEVPVQTDLNATTVLRLDHLFLNRDGLPIFVECKRSSNPDIRRVVVAQMLDYAANGLVYWGDGYIRRIAQKTYKDKLDDRIREFLNLDSSDVDNINNFWLKVDENLRNGKMGLVFVADELPRETRRLIEFLNERLSPSGIDVYGVEIRNYEGQGLRVVVPHIVGVTEKALAIKAQSVAGKNLTEDVFMQACSTETRQFFTKVLQWVQQNTYKIRWNPTCLTIGVPRTDLQTTEPGYYYLIYCYPPKDDTDSPELLQMFTGSLNLSPEQRSLLDDSILSSKIFTKQSDKTFNAYLDSVTLSRLDSVFDQVFAQVIAVLQQVSSQ